MMRTFVASALLVVFGLAAFAGCSGGDAPGTKPGKTGPSKSTKSSATTDPK